MISLYPKTFNFLYILGTIIAVVAVMVTESTICSNKLRYYLGLIASIIFLEYSILSIFFYIFYSS